MNSDPADSKAALLAAITATPAPTRRDVRARTLGALGLGLLVSVCAFLAVGGFREGGLPRDPVLIATTVVGTAAIAAGSALLTLRRRTALGPPRAWLRALVVAVPLAIFVWKVGWSALFVGGTDWWVTRPGLRCLGVSHLVGVPVVVAYLYARRGTDPLHPGLTAAGLGAAAGAFTALLLELWCPVGHPGHVLLGHVLPIATLTTLASLLGRRIVAT